MVKSSDSADVLSGAVLQGQTVLLLLLSGLKKSQKNLSICLR